MNNNELSFLLTVSEAAEIINVHPNTLRRWSDAGVVPSYRINTRGDRRFRREDLIRFITDYNAHK